MLNVDGMCMVEGIDYFCYMIGMLWMLCQNVDGLQDNVFVSNLISSSVLYLYVGQVLLLVLLVLSQVKGILIVGKFNGQVVLVVICVGYLYSDVINLLVLVVDDQIGILIFLFVMVIFVNVFKGGYVGVISGLVCGVVINNGLSGVFVSGNGLNVMIDYLELLGFFSGGFFYVNVGNCSDGIVVLLLVVNYILMLFQNGIVVFINLFMLCVMVQFGLDYM